MRKKTLNNQGVALVTVVLFFLVLVILLGGVMFSSITNQGNAKLSKDHTSAYYVAESGMNITIEAIKEYLVDNNFVKFLPSDNLTAKKAELKAYLTNASNWPPVILSGLNPTGMFSVLITESEDQFTVRVTGTVNNVSRTIQSTFDYDTILHPLAKAVFAQGKIEIQGNGQIIGPIASMMIPSGDDKNPTEINLRAVCSVNEVFVPANTSTSLLKYDRCNSTKTIDGAVKFNEFTLPLFRNLIPVNQSTVGNKTTITFPPLGSAEGYFIEHLPSTSIDFDLGSGSKSRILKLVVGDAINGGSSISSNAINVINDGNLMLDITVNRNDASGNPLSFFWDRPVNVGYADLSKFQLIIRKGSGFTSTQSLTFTTPNNLNFVGSILMDDINISVASFNFKGFIGTLGKEVKITSKSVVKGPMWIYAPNADFKLESQSTLNGSVISKTAVLNGTLTYDIYDGAIPFDLSLPSFMGGQLVPVGIKFNFINFREV